MATLQKIRTQGGLLVAIVIGFALVAFILGDLFQSGSSMFTGGRTEVGSIKGETIQYPDYQRKVEELAEIYRSNTGQSQLDEETWVQVREQTWEAMVRERVMGDVYDNLGLTISQDEMFDMLQGNNIHPIVQQIFTNPNTGEFERSAVVNFIRNLEFGVSPEQRNYWLYLERQILNERLQTKYNNLISKALYVTNDEAQYSLEGRNRNVSFEYIALNYSLVADTAVKATDKELRDYYAANKDEFKEEKSRQIEYITYEVVPSSSDFSSAEKWINEIREDFSVATDNVQFVTSNSDTGFDGTWYKQDNVPANLAGWIFEENAAVNDVFGPYFENNSYKLAKLHASEMMPDSVEARHILLAVNAAEEAMFAQALADSLKGLIDGGSDFATLARQYSTDTGSAINGGDLGWFGRGMMVKPFEEAAFNNKVNEVTVVPSQFGLHIVQTTRRGGLTRQVQVAVLERTVTPSTLTYQSVYGQASKFVSENTTKEKFDAAVAAENLTKRQATLLENDRTIVGLESPRALIRAAFDAKTGAILKNIDGSPIFELGDNFVVATLVKASEGGPAPFESVKTRVELAVEKKKKGEFLAEKIRKAAEGKSDMYEIAASAEGSVNIASNINFNSMTLPGLGTEPVVIGTVTALEPGTISKPIIGNNAVFLTKVTNIEEGGETDVDGEKARLLQALGFRASYQAYEALKDAVEVVDNRSKFF
jgi:peptidyl-prolyl cis-trans isomerase D